MALRSFATMARRATQHVRVVLPRAHFVNSLTLPRSCRRHMSEVPKKPQFYRRPLPDTCISFSSTQGKEFFKEALSEGTMETYFPLAEQFLTQDEPAFCGLTSLAMILNALAVDPGRVWKGPWRWYTESLLDCCEPLEVVQSSGIDLPTFLSLAKCNGAAVDCYYADRSNIDEFRSIVRTVSTDARALRFLVVSYSRKLLGQTGDGHFSPIGGYHAGRDLVLLLDVARFKYAPHWVPLEAMFEAMQRVDPTTGRCRGFVTLGRSRIHASVLFAISKARLGQCNWQRAVRQLQDVVANIDQAGSAAGGAGYHGISDVSLRCDGLLRGTPQWEAALSLIKVLHGELGVVMCDATSCTHVQPRSGSGLDLIQYGHVSVDVSADWLTTEHATEIAELRRQIEATDLFAVAAASLEEEEARGGRAAIAAGQGDAGGVEREAGSLLVTQLCGLSDAHALVVLALAVSTMVPLPGDGGHKGAEVLMRWMRDTDALPNVLHNEVRMIRLQLQQLQGRRFFGKIEPTPATAHPTPPSQTN